MKLLTYFKTSTVISHFCPYRQLVDGLLQPQADERGEGVVENKQHDGIYKVVPLTLRVHNKLPCVGAVALNNGGEAKYSAETERQVYELRNRPGFE